MSEYGFILAPLFGWLSAQGIKFVVSLRKDGLQLRDFYSSGGFPSSHTASTVSLATLIGLTEGFSTPLFAVAALLSAIVMYDAAGVRRSVGEHTILLKKLTGSSKQHQDDGSRLHIFLGHTPAEVMGGVVLGVVVGSLVSMFSA